MESFSEKLNTVIKEFSIVSLEETISGKTKVIKHFVTGPKKKRRERKIEKI